MKKLINNILRAALVVFVLGVSSCQEEYEEVGGGNESQTISASSTTAVLIKNTSSKDGSFDNIVDGASCFAIQFPYTVNANGVEINIDSMEDLDLIEEIFDQLEDDNDILDIVFPITITLSDFSEITIQNQDELAQMARECLEGGDDDDIECIDFVYPITLFTFGIDNQQANEIQVKSDQEMRRFFGELEDDQLISIEFPITLKKYDGTTVTITSNAELAAALELAKNECDEDDDDDYNDDDFTEEELDAFLMECPLQVREVIREGTDNTEQYMERLMTFNEDGTVIFSTFTANEITGAWSTSMSDNGVMLSLDFENFTDFTSEWKVYKLEEGVIKLYKDGGNRIVLKKRCDLDSGENLDPEVLRTVLGECEWIIKKVKNQGEEIDRLLGYEFEFLADGVITLSNDVNTSQGVWEIGLNSQLQQSIMITMGDEPSVSFEWPIKELTDNRLKVEIPESGNEMVLLRVCEDSVDDEDVVAIRNFALDGPWKIALYMDGDDDDTALYADMDFHFSTMSQITVFVNQDPIANGLWRVLRDTEEGLKFYINFDTGDDLAALTQDWKVVSVTATRIELMHVNDDDSSDTLVFEKP